MSDAKDIAEIAADGVADGMHIVGEEALAMEKVVRGIDGARIGYIGLGIAIGAAAGAMGGFVVAMRKAETKYSQIAAEEIAEMRQHYADKIVSLDNQKDKPHLATLVKDQGYIQEESSEHPPMAVTPPTAVVEAANDNVEEEEEVVVETKTRNIFKEAEVQHTWDIQKERQRRSPLKPYVIHRDERDATDAYDEVTFTYYEEDDVVCNELDEVVSAEDRERLLGETNLEKFGHGSGDASIVYIRNDQLEMVFEVVRSPNSYAEEVHGLEPEIRHSDRYRRERAHFDDE